jgi:hypothetical protein
MREWLCRASGQPGLGLTGQGTILGQLKPKETDESPPVSFDFKLSQGFPNCVSEDIRVPRGAQVHEKIGL